MYALLLTSFVSLFIANQAGINDGFAEFGAYDDIYADASHYCCTQYDTRSACVKSANYACTYLNAKRSATDKAIIRRFGHKCVGSGFASCKRKDIGARCFEGCQEDFCPKPTCELLSDDVCLWDTEDDEMILNRALNINSGSANVDYKLFGSIGLILLVVASAVYYYKKRNNDNEKSTEIVSSGNGGYGTTLRV